jgi:hypothetical protein
VLASNNAPASLGLLGRLNWELLLGEKYLLDVAEEVCVNDEVLVV